MQSRNINSSVVRRYFCPNYPRFSIPKYPVRITTKPNTHSTPGSRDMAASPEFIADLASAIAYTFDKATNPIGYVLWGWAPFSAIQKTFRFPVNLFHFPLREQRSLIGRIIGTRIRHSRKVYKSSCRLTGRFWIRQMHGSVL